MVLYNFLIIEFKFISKQKLQLAFARKQLTPGLNVAIDSKKNYVNDEVRRDIF